MLVNPVLPSLSSVMKPRPLRTRRNSARVVAAATVTNALALTGGMRMVVPSIVRAARVGPPALRAFREATGAEEFDDRLRAKLLAMDPHAFARMSADLTRFASAAPALRAIGCPTMVMVGEQDTEFLAPAHAVVAEVHAGGNGDAWCQIVPDAAHSSQQENTAAWVDLVAAHALAARRHDLDGTAVAAE
jgi:pimeloyl-ACP methyl ester carboxylesterase